MTNEREPLEPTEAQRRDLAHAHMGEVEEDAHRVVAKDLKQMISLRLDSTLAGCLREMALEQGTSVSDLLRDAALRIVEEHQMALGAALRREHNGLSGRLTKKEGRT